jgi:hypothetical protein
MTTISTALTPIAGTESARTGHKAAHAGHSSVKAFPAVSRKILL